MADPAGTIDVNVNGTLSVLSSCAENNVEGFIFASSAAVYGEAASLPAHEGQAMNPFSPYGASKAAGESLISILKNARKIPHATSLRFFNVYGRGLSPEYAGVITRFGERLSKGLAPVIYGDGKQTRDFVSVDDVVQAIVLATENEISGAFNIGTGIPTSVKDLAKQMILIHGLNVEPIYEPSKDGDIRFSYADISKAKRLLNFAPQSGLYPTLQKILNLPDKSASVLTN